MKHDIRTTLSSYIDALYPIIYINHYDFKAIDEVIASISEGVKCLEYDNALGLVNFKDKHPMADCDLIHFLQLTMDEGFCGQTFLILKDVHHQLENPKVIALLRRIAENTLYRDDFQATVFILSDIVKIPRELENLITICDLPLPDIDEITAQIDEFAHSLQIDVEQNVVNNIALSLKGLNSFQIRQILNLAYQDGGCINRDDEKLILKEKEQVIKKSGMLEVVSVNEGLGDIGGLENLKEWLTKKSRIFADLDKAIKFGVDIPKGILIVGMPGCGKSLSAKAASSLFKMPLVRLDVGRLLGKYVGESEANMRKALFLSEAISPCVLWVDEIEKAFSGVKSDASDGNVTNRLFGQFLTWMQEKKNTVFIIATANNISGLPLEFLRKGRFDELFFVDLPNKEERAKILEIHLKNRHKWNKEIDVIPVVKLTDGYCGADLEAIVKDAIEEAFLSGNSIVTSENLLNSQKKIKSISESLKEQMNDIRNSKEKIDLQPASKETH